MEKKIRIVTDSTADLSPDVAAEYGIEVLPLSVIIGDQVYRDGVDLTPSQFYPLLMSSPVLPTTSQVSPGQFMQCFQRLVQEGYEVISIHLSQGLSSTVETARSMAEQVGKGKVTVLDSSFLSLGQAFQVVEAAQMARGGHNVQQIVDHLSQIRAKTELLFTLDTLEYLRKGGRIGRVSAILGQLLNLKPLIRVENGVYVSFGKARSQAKAMDEFIHFIREKAGDQPVRIAIAHGQAMDAALKLKELVMRSLKVVEDIAISEVGPVIGVHTGPGTLGLAFYPVEA